MVLNHQGSILKTLKRSERFRGFTLIELLIVIAIILILIAIALPNFLGARIRAQVTRVKGDMKTIANALEMYYAQNNRYINPCYPEVSNQIDVCPTSVGGGYGQGFLWISTGGGLSATSKGIQLTSPTVFLTELPFDPFMTATLTNPNFLEASSIYYGKTRNHRPGHPAEPTPTYGPPPYNIVLGGTTWVMHSFGPDLLQDGNQPGYGNDGYIYSPTNGVKSYGDIRYYSDRGFLEGAGYGKSN